MIKYIDNLTDKLDDAKNLISLLRQAKEKKTFSYIGLDTETTGLDPFTSQVLLIQLRVGEDIYLLHRGRLGKQFVTNLMQLIEDSGVRCIGHNIKFDIKMIREDTGVWLNNIYDTMIAEAVITSGLGGKYVSLLDLVNKYCGVELDKESRLEFIELNHQSDFSEKQITYAARDVLYLFDIYEHQLDLINKAKLNRIIDIECRIEPIVARMEREGITLDVDHWNKLTRDAEVKRNELAKKMKEVIFDALDPSIYENAYQFANAVAIPVKTKKLKNSLESISDPSAVKGWMIDNFNTASHKQLLTALNLAGIETPDTNEKTLNKLPKNEIIDTILDYRDYEKRLSTYGDNVVAGINIVTHKIHTDFNQVGTASGRFSSSGVVNMQNIPVHNGYREGFIARPGYTLLACDYSQQEYRLAGAISKEPKIVEAYVNGYDMHTATAALRFKKDLHDVTSDERNKGKAINFTILYGGTEYALGKNLDIPQNEAKDLLEQFLTGYPVLAKHKEISEKKIAELGYSVTLMGRRRYWKPLPAFATPNEVNNYINRMKREGYNHIIQGTGADVTKLAILDVFNDNPFDYLLILLLQVHDEIVLEVHDSILKEAEEFVKFKMEEAFRPFLGCIPAKVDAKTGKRWKKG